MGAGGNQWGKLTRERAGEGDQGGGIMGDQTERGMKQAPAAGVTLCTRGTVKTQLKKASDKGK